MKKMKNTKYHIFALIFSLGLFSACEVLEPEDENVYDLEDVKSVVIFAEGLLMNPYRNVIGSHESFPLAYACDDAVNNDPTNNIKTLVAGGWTANENPFNEWNGAYENILYINSFMEIIGDIEWYWKNATTDSIFAVKLKGEAHALRAWDYFHLLQAHAGKGANGEMLGVPIVDRVLSTAEDSDYKIPRSTFNDLVEFILADCDTAINLLPQRWVSTGDVPADKAIGERNNNRINGHVAQFLKVKTLLYAASPAFSDGTYTYQMAAEAAVALMDSSNNLANITSANSDHIEFYSNLDVVNAVNLHPEVIWRSFKENASSDWESTNYPPSLYGEGLTNPSQNLVNAFPMLDGTPTPDSKINSDDPYSGRDPRLDKYIIYNGATFTIGAKNIVFDTKSGTQDALGSLDNFSTKSGYYLKKFMNLSSVDLDPTVESEGMHYYTFVRYTDVLLMFAEAANEALDPDGDIGGYNARQVINAIRDRAGITSTAYVDGLDKAGMTELIRNERRIEMCFENQRFWDLRRWKLTDQLNEPVYGVRVSADGLSYSYEEVETRQFQDYQIYGPIPYGETLKYNLVQNEGW
ncbi:MAG: RagB/SusD family nutrient uptake outer membrane protein [Bacteroidales bacterium]|nr:RagB/SusD family nutrient uptake outer membrane protein [Bacteroidales bacterium]